MNRLPPSTNEALSQDDEIDFDLDLDDLDDAALQRLLDEDPALSSELEALEKIDSADEGAASDDPDADELPPTVEAEPVAEIVEVDQDDRATEDHDDLADFDYEDEEFEAAPSADATIGEETYEAIVSDDSIGDVRPVPRINIHVFSLTDHVANLVEKASADRRLAKAHVTLQSGSASRAAEIYSSEPTPNLIIVESGTSTQELLSGLDQLAQVCDPSTRVIVVGDINDIGLYRELMDRGISEYVVRPHSPLHLIGAIGNLFADPSTPPIGKSYVFVGSRGGSGSSSVCHNVSWALSEKFKSDTVLMDLDLAFGTAGLDFEHDPSQGLAEALGAPERLDDVLLDRLLQKVTDRLSVFVAPNALERDYDLPAESFETVVDIVRSTAPSIVIDLPHVWSAWSRHLLQSADEIVLTATPDLASFRNAKNIAEIIKGHRTNDAPPVVVLNQVGVPKRPEVPLDQFEEALELPVRACVPWDPVLFGNAATNGQPLMEISPKAKPTQEVNAIASILLGQADLNKKSGGFSLKSLFSKRG
ncbi:MAG: AAA family ATPase [Parvularcula sp.]